MQPWGRGQEDDFQGRWYENLGKMKKIRWASTVLGGVVVGHRPWRGLGGWGEREGNWTRDTEVQYSWWLNAGRRLGMSRSWKVSWAVLRSPDCPEAKGATGRYGPKESFSQICFSESSPWLPFGEWPGEEVSQRWGAQLGVCGNDPEERSQLLAMIIERSGRRQTCGAFWGLGCSHVKERWEPAMFPGYGFRWGRLQEEELNPAKQASLRSGLVWGAVGMWAGYLAGTRYIEKQTGESGRCGW